MRWQSGIRAAAWVSAGSTEHFAANGMSLIVLRDFLVSGKAKETMGRRRVSLVEKFEIWRVYMRVKVIDRGSSTRVFTCNLTFHRPIDTLPLCYRAEILNVSPGNNSRSNLC